MTATNSPEPECRRYMKVYRVMKPHLEDPNRPRPGKESCCLGVRDGEMPVDAEGMTGPGHKKGMSVNASLETIAPQLVPPQYGNRVEGPGGKKSHWVWTMGKGPFINGPLAPRLQLDCDGGDHGLAEPDGRMLHSQYVEALADTQADWSIVKPI